MFFLVLSGLVESLTDLESKGLAFNLEQVFIWIRPAADTLARVISMTAEECTAPWMNTLNQQENLASTLVMCIPQQAKN